MEDQGMIVGYATFLKYSCLRSTCDRLRVRDKRKVFNLMRSEKVDENSFLPQEGYTLGEFSIMQVLNDTGRRSSLDRHAPS